MATRQKTNKRTQTPPLSKILIANPRLEKRVTPWKHRGLQISNREYIAVFQFAFCAAAAQARGFGDQFSERRFFTAGTMSVSTKMSCSPPRSRAEGVRIVFGPIYNFKLRVSAMRTSF